MTEYKYTSDWIHKLEDKAHWILYWNQVSLLLEAAEKDDSILEIGKGSGFTSNYLTSKGFRVTTIDIDPDKKPDILTNIVTYPFDEKYDHILAFEVIEHIPYDEMELVMRKLYNACNKSVIISVPRNQKIWFTIDIKTLLFQRTYSLATIRNKLTTDNHFWEIDYQSYSLERFRKFLKTTGFTITEERKQGATLFFRLSK